MLKNAKCCYVIVPRGRCRPSRIYQDLWIDHGAASERISCGCMMRIWIQDDTKSRTSGIFPRSRKRRRSKTWLGGRNTAEHFLGLQVHYSLRGRLVGRNMPLTSGKAYLGLSGLGWRIEFWQGTQFATYLIHSKLRRQTPQL